MVKKLSIQNYKSIKQLDLNCKKVNVFIGEPNAGKSNIMEALSFFSFDGGDQEAMSEILRFKTMGNLFYDFAFNSPIKVETDKLSFELSVERSKTGPVGNEFLGLFYDPSVPNGKKKPLCSISFNHEGGFNSRQTAKVGFFTFFRSYYFKRLDSFKLSYQNYLSTPYGDNIPNLLMSNAGLKKIVSDIYREKGFRLLIKPIENEISISKEVNEELYSYPYYAISETLQRIVFMVLAIESNKSTTIIFDEPESNTFPFYTKYIAERIALDQTNQFFMTTHNPYLLMSIIEKAKFKDLNIFVTRMEKYQTKVALLSNEQVGKAFDYGSDVFLNLNNIIK